MPVRNHGACNHTYDDANKDLKCYQIIFMLTATPPIRDLQGAEFKPCSGLTLDRKRKAALCIA